MNNQLLMSLVTNSSRFFLFLYYNLLSKAMKLEISTIFLSSIFFIKC